MHTYFMHASLFGMYSNTIYLTTAVIIVLSQSAAELVIAPNNAESKVGDATYFNCSTNLTSGEEIFWYHGSQYIYIGDAILDPYRGRFEIDRNASSGSHNLVIHSVKPSDAGQYMCVDDDGHGTKRSADLVVLDNDPDCQSNIQPDGVIGQNSFNIPPDEVNLTCSVTYYGNIPPKIQWKKIGDDSLIKGNMISIVTSTNRSMVTLKLKGDISLNRSSFVCQTTRSTGRQYKCTSEIIKVLSFMGGDTAENRVLRGTNIACIVNENTFPCISQWYHDNFTCPISCDESITTHLLGEYRCTVKCHLRGFDHHFEAQKVYVFEEPANQQLLTQETTKIWVSTAIPIIMVIILAASIAVLIAHHQRNRKPRTFMEAMKYASFACNILVCSSDKDKQDYFDKTGQDPTELIELMKQFELRLIPKFSAKETSRSLARDNEANPAETTIELLPENRDDGEKTA